MSHDPLTSQQITTAFLDVFNQRHRKLYSTEEYLRAVREVKATAQQALDDVTDQIHQIAQEHLISPDLLATEKEGLVLSLTSLRTSFETAKAEREVVEKALAELTQRLTGDGEDVIKPTIERTIELQPLENPKYRAQSQRIISLLIKLDELKDTYKPTTDRPNELVINAQKRYDDANDELKTIPPFLDAEKRVITEINRDYVDALNLQAQLKTRLGILSASIDTAERLLRDDGKRLQVLKSLTPQLVRLQRWQACLFQNVQDYERKEAMIKPAEQLDESNKTNLYVLQHASLPYQKSGPNRIKYVLIGSGAGLVLSLALVALLGFADRRVRRPEDLEDLGFKVLAVVPVTGGWRKAQRRATQIPIEPIEPTRVGQ